VTDAEIRAVAAQLAFDVGISREEAERVVRESIAKGSACVEFDAGSSPSAGTTS